MKTSFKNLSLFTAVIAATVIFGVLNSPRVSAAPPTPWNPGRIIDDSVFFSPNTMSAQDIQNFLNSKVPVCDTNHAASGSNTPPFTCLKDYTDPNVPTMAADAYCGKINGGSMSSATIIKTVSAACSINPQVLLVLLQKEQGLVTDTWPWKYQYQFATGFCVYDDPNAIPPACQGTDGFFNQVYYAARQFEKYSKQPSGTYRPGQTSYIAYSPDGNCGGANVYIENQATAGLYNYTPYQPNQAAIAAGYNSATCGAYGNRNFWLYFWDWFGNPIGPEYAWLIDNFTYSGGDSSIAQGQTETITLKAKNVSRHPWYKVGVGNNPIRLGTWGAGRASPLLNGGTRYAEMQESVVNPNEIATFSFTITPQNIGTYVEGMNLVAENATWMAWPGLSPTINVTPAYSWKVSDVIYGSGTGYMDPGTSQLITVKAINDGSVTWSKTSGPQIWLGTWGPGRVSAVGYNWPSGIRATQMNENTVAPGQVAGFQFYVRAPSSGMFYERMNLVAEGQTWFNDPGLTLYLQGNTYSAQVYDWSYSTPSAEIPRGQKFTITVKAKNTGTAVWRNSGGYPVRLGTADPLNRGSALEDSSWVNSIRPATLQEASVAPGGTGTFVFTATSPPVPGVRLEGFNLVAEGVQWFTNDPFHLYIKSL